MRNFQCAAQLLCSAVVIATSIVPQTIAGTASCNDTQNTNFEINGAGASLFVDYLVNPLATNDYIDVDNDGCFGFFDSDSDGLPDRVDQLAPNIQNPNGYWRVQYRSVGSIEGFIEFCDYQNCGDLPENIPSDRGLQNSLEWANTGAPRANAGGPPCTGDPDNDSIPNASNSPNCITKLNFALTDVPAEFGIRTGTFDNIWYHTPGQSGYGTNTATSHGTPAQSGQGYLLPTLTGACGHSLNLNTASPNADTLYQTRIAWSPVAIITNRGTGIDLDHDGVEDTYITFSQLRHGFTTGRLKSGENLVFATRDGGSGTRNAAMNSLGIDPSRGIGDNIGFRQDVDTNMKPGPNAQYTNCGGSGVMETAVQNCVLAVGYTGVLGGSRAAGDSRAGSYEILGVIKDVSLCGGTGTNVVRPTLATMVANGSADTGYQIGGRQTIETRGNPRAHDFGPRAPQRESGVLMTDIEAAKFVRNIEESIRTPQAADDKNMPGEWLARGFLLVAAVDTLSSLSCPMNFNDTNVDPAIQAYVLANNAARPGASGEPAQYGDNDIVTNNFAGRIPARRAPLVGTYRDGGTTGYRYWDGSSFRLASSGGLSRRNRLTGDLNNDGRRDINDIEKFVDAHYSFQVNGADATLQNFEPIQAGPVGGMAVDRLIVHVVGDLNGDGEFNQEDIRYFADGEALKVSDGKLDRKAGFTRADARWNTLAGNLNLFGVTTKSTGHPYKAGDARGDVTGSASGPAAGASPLGWNNVIDCNDVTYVCQNFTNDWANTDLSQGKDLSCDMNGDLRVDFQDVVELVVNILDTKIGDVNLDGVVDINDENIVLANLGNAGCYCTGDMNGDGLVNAADLAIVQCARTLVGDANCDGSVNNFDIDSFVAGILNLGSPTTPVGYGGNQDCWNRRACWGDVNHDAAFNNFDIDSFVACILSSPAPATPCP